MNIKQENQQVIIMAAGSAPRWGNYFGIPKHLVKIDGETILKRTIRLLRGRGVNNIVVTVPKKGYYGDLSGCEEVIGSSEVEIDKFLNAEKIFVGSAIFLWGDTYFTESAIDIILSEKREMCFFGRKGGSEITGKDWGEIFAVKADNYFMKKANELKEMKDKLPRCASWELYRLISGYPLDKHIVGKYFKEIDDETDDFDYPIDYDRWMHRDLTLIIKDSNRPADLINTVNSIKYDHNINFEIVIISNRANEEILKLLENVNFFRFYKTEKNKFSNFDPNKYTGKYILTIDSGSVIKGELADLVSIFSSFNHPIVTVNDFVFQNKERITCFAWKSEYLIETEQEKIPVDIESYVESCIKKRLIEKESDFSSKVAKLEEENSQYRSSRLVRIALSISVFLRIIRRKIL